MRKDPRVGVSNYPTGNMPSTRLVRRRRASFVFSLCLFFLLPPDVAHDVGADYMLISVFPSMTRYRYGDKLKIRLDDVVFGLPIYLCTLLTSVA